MVSYDRTDLEFILTQIKMAEVGQPALNPFLPFGLREVAGTNNSIVPGQETYGSAGEPFPRMTEPLFRTVTINIDGTIFDPNPGVEGDTMTTTYASTASDGMVVDSDPRLISNLISDQSSANAAAVEAAAAAMAALGTGYQYNPATPVGDDDNLFISNITPDAGLSAPFNTWMTLFGQFFDHGLDLIRKGGSGVVFIPLQPDDPLYVEGSPNNFMVVTRATNLAGEDGLLGTADDLHEGTNLVTPFVDQNQTYASHPSHQVFLREYMVGSDGRLHSTGKLLSHIGADGSRGLATWADLKANALKLGILLSDADVNGVPLLATDAYGNVLLGPNGFAQVVVRTDDGADGIAGTSDDTTILVEGNAAGLDLSDTVALGGTVVRTGIAFIDDKNHNADPFDAQTGALRVADADSDIGNAPAAGTYDDELLDAHYVAGDGRINENLGLTAVHEVFHSEHDRLVEQTKALVLAELAKGDTSFALEWVLPGTDLSDGIQDDEWNGERLFQAGKFGTETQYQHLVFEEFARKIAPTIHVAESRDINLDPAITAEFANVVYRFGHSMLTETFNIDADPDTDGVQQMSLIEAFTNPLGYLTQGAAGIIEGSVGQIANEIDEFVTGALRNNLLGLPLDLAAINIARGRDTGVAPLNLVRNQIYAQIGDSNLKPYESWSEFGQFLKHPASLINFVAAYGTHASIVGATTLEDKRAAALQLVVDGLDPANMGTDAWDFMHSTGAYANDVNNPLAVHATWSTGSVTGLDTVDLWIGGLAEKQTLNGGLLGSTFQIIFETQLEALQDADRLYYIERLEGLHFGSEIEGNSFAELIRANTGVKHLPGDVFLTPEYVIEASTITDDPSTWLRNPETGALLVERLADGTIRFIGDDNFLGNTIVLGGTEGDDRLVAGQADDDTVWGDGGNDYIDGGDGADFLYGGDGHDLILGGDGDDVIHGDAGNDTIFAGRGDDAVFGGDGDDYIDVGDSGPVGVDGLGDAVDGGLGNDILIGGDGSDEMLGNEGDDWIEGGIGFDIIFGDQGAPTGQIPLVGGNDVLIGGAHGDRMMGFSGDDIMLGFGGFDRFEGRLGFDWASFEQEERGVSVDMNRRAFVDTPQVPGGDAIRDLFDETEGISGSAFGDYLQGTDVGTGNPLGTAGFDVFNELTNVNLISGLADYFPAGPVAFSDGNIMFGGGGSDFIEGRGGNDIIDGDAYLHVELTAREAGAQIIREIRYDQVNAPVFDEDTFTFTSAGDIDTAVFSDVSTNYQINLVTDPVTGDILFGTDGNPVLQVVHTPVAGGVDDGTDTLYNMERLQFADVTIDNPFAQFVSDFVAQGTLTIDNLNPQVGDTISIVSSTINDFEGILVGGVLDPLTAGFERIDIPLEALTLQWQYLDPVPVGGNAPQWVNIAGATGPSYTVPQFFNGFPIRVVASFTDGLGVHEMVASAPTADVVPNAAINLAPFIEPQTDQPGLPDTSALEDTPLGTAARPGLYLNLLDIFGDDHTAANRLVYTATLADGSALDSVGLAFEIVPDANGLVAAGLITGTPPQDFNGPIEVRITATDEGGLAVTDTFTINVLPVNDGPGITSDGGGDFAAVSVLENTTAVTTVTAADPDAGATLTFSIVGGEDAALFAIDPITGALSFITPPNFEAPGDADSDNVYNVVVTVSDGTLTDTQSIAVTVGDANDAPVIVSSGGGDNAALSVPENSTAVTTVAATDEDAGATLAYAIVGGADASLFAIDPTTGVLSFIAAPDFEEPADADGDNVYDLIVSASDGVLDDTQAIAVAVSNVTGLTLTGTTAGNIIEGSGEEDIIDGLNGNDILSGGGGNDIVIGGVGSDIMSGNDGDDVLIGGGGNDIMNGGAGDDTFVYAIGDGSDIIDGGDGFDTVAISGSAANETLDVIFNGTVLTNFESAIVSNVETATADLGGGTDTLTYFGSVAPITANLTTGTASGFTSIAGIENVTGGSGNDLLTGDAANNVLNGGAGNDTFFATVNDGNDTYNGAGGNDTYDLSATSAGATVTTTSATSAETGVDILQSIENIIGSQGNDIITTSGSASFVDGQAGDDVIDAGSGNDTIIGGLGNDVLTGGPGNDTFVFAAGFGNDIITDFDGNPSGGQDLLDISGLGITAATFATSVLIEAVGNDTLVTIGTDTILLQGVGAGTNVITQQDFLLLA